MDKIESVMKYFGLEDEELAEKLCWILEELHTNYGPWGDKVSSYLSSLLSGTSGSRSLIPPSSIETYKSLFLNYGKEGDSTSSTK